MDEGEHLSFTEVMSFLITKTAKQTISQINKVWVCDLQGRFKQILPGVFDDAGQSIKEIVLCHVLPVQHDTHPFGCNTSHGVIMVSKKGHTHNGYSMIHGLVDAVQAPMAQKSPCVSVAYMTRGIGKFIYIWTGFVYLLRTISYVSFLKYY